MSAVSSPVAPELLRRALREIRTLKAQVKELRSAKSEPIAVVGMACRFPGAHDADAFWDLLARGGDAITEVPPDRWDVDAYYDPDPDAPGKMYTRWGGFLDRIDEFGPAFFSIAPREAVSMDPQQRLLLEISWQALENAEPCPGPVSGASRSACLSGLAPPISANWRSCRAPPRSTPTTAPAARCRSRPGGSRIFSACADRRSRSTRPAPRRWRRCIWPYRACATARARSDWSAASI